VGAQTAEDAERLSALGATSVSVTGNLKFDVRIDPTLQALGQEWRAQLQAHQAHRPIWLAASTREGEEALILAAHRILCAASPEPRPLLVLVPRHPQRFIDAANLVTHEGFRLTRRSEALPSAESDVWLGDSMGEMVAYYSMVDVAVIGGSLLPFGGQNLIEAAACGIPLIVGPHTYNFSAAALAAEQSGAATRVEAVTPETLATAVNTLLSNQLLRHEAQVAAARAETGATDKLLALIAQYHRP
jgi:3-deoxy-D-manno-octulosonic-acid transferase